MPTQDSQKHWQLKSVTISPEPFERLQPLWCTREDTRIEFCLQPPNASYRQLIVNNIFYKIHSNNKKKMIVSSHSR